MPAIPLAFFILTLFPALNHASSSYDPGGKFSDIGKSLNTGNIAIDLKYAGRDNFVHSNMYAPIGLDRAFISKSCLPQLRAAATRLKTEHPELNLVVYDSLRPLRAQLQMWKVATGQMAASMARKYVAEPIMDDPQKVSMHNLGLAVDVGLETKRHRPLDMGTPFDSFSNQSHIDASTESQLSDEARAHRQLLREVMTGGPAHFQTYENEWWHFNCMNRADAGDRNQFPIAK